MPEYRCFRLLVRNASTAGKEVFAALVYPSRIARRASARAAIFLPANNTFSTDHMKTYVATPSTRTREWVVVDADGQTLGRLATRIADTLRGKNKPEYTPHIDTGDFVVVINAEKIKVTGKKLTEKVYYRHTGYPGGLRERTLEEQLERRPEEVIRGAVKGMIPRTKLGRAQLRKLKVYVGDKHPHEAQKPNTTEVNAQ